MDEVSRRQASLIHRLGLLPEPSLREALARRAQGEDLCAVLLRSGAISTDQCVRLREEAVAPSSPGAGETVAPLQPPSSSRDTRVAPAGGSAQSEYLHYPENAHKAVTRLLLMAREGVDATRLHGEVRGLVEGLRSRPDGWAF